MPGLLGRPEVGTGDEANSGGKVQVQDQKEGAAECKWVGRKVTRISILGLSWRCRWVARKEVHL